VADCTQAVALIDGVEAGFLIGDKAYDTDEIINHGIAHDMKIVIPPKSNRLVQREYDKHIYKIRHLVENTIRKLKEWRGIATRYAKKSASFLACVQIRCMMLWLKIS
jgi:transposase